MKSLAKLTVMTGPDRGKLFELGGEIVQIGKGAGNGFILTDATLEDHQVSIVRRNGRFAIYAPLTDQVEVDGTQIPRDRWVWPPDTAQIQLNRRTSLEFSGAGRTCRAARAYPRFSKNRNRVAYLGPDFHLRSRNTAAPARQCKFNQCKFNTGT